MYKLVLLRHGESVWNKQNRFTGWTDVALSARGRREAIQAGRELKKNGFKFDLAFTSLLKRATNTLRLALKEMLESQIPVEYDWRLNERHYGNLQGQSKLEMIDKVGLKKVMIWRRSYDVRPPLIKPSNPYNQIKDIKYAGIKVPRAESLKDVVARVVPLWKEEILPAMMSGKKVLVVASGNSLRALIKYLDKLTPATVSKLNIPTGIPLVYEFNRKWRPQKHYYLANQATLVAAVDKVKNQTPTK